MNPRIRRLVMIAMFAMLLATHARADVIEPVRKFEGDNDFDPALLQAALRENGATHDARYNALPFHAEFNSGWVTISVDPRPKPITQTIRIFSLDNPLITAPEYWLNGYVGYRNVEGAAYLELRSEFPDGRVVFARSLADEGNDMKLSGTSADRIFALTGEYKSDPAPSRLVLNLVMPGSGQVRINQMTLMEERPSTTPTPVPVAVVPAAPPARRPYDFWFRDRTLGWGIVALGFPGLFGFAEILLRRGVGRRPLLVAVWAFWPIGLAYMVWWAVGIGRGEPASQISPLFFGAVMLLIWPPLASRAMRRRYAKFELRQMAAMDAG